MQEGQSGPDGSETPLGWWTRMSDKFQARGGMWAPGGWTLAWGLMLTSEGLLWGSESPSGRFHRVSAFSTIV